MAKFGKVSMVILDTCDARLQHLFLVVVETYDCAIIRCYENIVEPDTTTSQGKSKLKSSKVKINTTMSKAIDVAPFINGKISLEPKAVIKFAKFVLETAKTLDINISWGGDFNMNDLDNDKFKDYVHFELI